MSLIVNKRVYKCQHRVTSQLQRGRPGQYHRWCIHRRFCRQYLRAGSRGMKCWYRNSCASFDRTHRSGRAARRPAFHTSRSFFTVALNKAVPLLCTTRWRPVKCCRKARTAGGVLPLRTKQGTLLHHPPRRITIVDMSCILSGPAKREFTRLLEVSLVCRKIVRRVESAPLARMTGARRWKRKTESTASRPDGGVTYAEGGGKKKK